MYEELTGKTIKVKVEVVIEVALDAYRAEYADDDLPTIREWAKGEATSAVVSAFDYAIGEDIVRVW